MIVIVNCGIGNLDSVLRAFTKCGEEAMVSARPEDVERAAGLVLPGVGSFAQAMENLNASGLRPALDRKVLEEKRPVLGICLGFQMFTRHSEEGDAEGLGWIDGVTRRFDFGRVEGAIKVPHLGWNDLEVQKDNPLLQDVPRDACFYFAHSYCVACSDSDAILSTTRYGYDFVSAVACGNVFGTQFHPEKSHSNGLKLIRNFIEQVRHA